MSFKSNNPEPTTHNSQLGFTLLEILIAMAILAILATLVYASFDSSMKVIDRVDQGSDVFRQARLVLTRVSEDLSMAYRPKGDISPDAIFIGRDAVVAGRAQDSLRFTSLSHLRTLPDEPASDFNLIEYSLELDPEEETWALLRKEEANPYSLTESGGAVLLAEKIHSLDLRYFDGKTWVDDWDPAINQGLPWVVAIEIKFQEPGGDQRSFQSWVELALAK